MLKRPLLILLLAALPFAAQGDEGWPRAIPHATGTLTLNAPPERIVSTSPSLTGTLLAIGAPVIASASAKQGEMTDEAGFFRQWAGIAHDRGVKVLYPDMTFDIEAIILQDPDLIVVSETGGDSVLEFVPELEAMGFPVLVLNYGINSWEALAETLGRVSGQETEAARVTEDFTARARAAGKRIAHPEGHVSIISYNFFGTYGISKPESAQARVLAEMGFDVAGIPEEMRGMVQASREFDFVSHENLPAAITGSTIFLLAANAEDVKTVIADPVLANLPAVQAGRVYPLGPTSFRVDYYSGQNIIDTVAEHLSK